MSELHEESHRIAVAFICFHFFGVNVLGENARSLCVTWVFLRVAQRWAENRERAKRWAFLHRSDLQVDCTRGCDFNKTAPLERRRSYASETDTSCCQLLGKRVSQRRDESKNQV